ncbi:phytanoyl-CoA dioxygenase family protein [Sphingobium sufflavum]|uniref:phytanoyl-CoA dioxygenase family protein n=1 Tax=Sphingobium sufflavum TaxID=1129547 RepID=UPI001F461C3A|nr:phytanoyl-CoA dioxygenase family protein [Sphingobium sufflavum]MCE7798587.1 phytanoyl-CoA dioxygenase family protein [Sphingobium sufflavum]
MTSTAIPNPLPGVPLVESPLFPTLVDHMGLSEEERAIAVALNRDGFATLDFPDPDIGARMDRIIARFGPTFADPSAHKRIQDGWLVDEDVRAIASNAVVLALLSKLYGRAAFPFQTLNFPVGTQQNLHSDSVHFSSLPERFMCGVWLAFEDIGPNAGPLVYHPGSHRWPVPSNAMLARRGQDGDRRSAQEPFEPFWQAMIDATQSRGETFLARKGQALIWAANLLHGGSVRHDPALSRWSQVTHYYFEDCIYYTPAFSDEVVGKLDLRYITNIATGAVEPNRHLGTVVPMPVAQEAPVGWRQKRRIRRELREKLPADFDAEGYYRLNPDVAVLGLDAGRHYVLHGQGEGRRYKLD